MAKKITGNMATYLFHEGTNFNAYDYLGVHKTIDGDRTNYVFRVWAPNAKSVYVAGDFNGWGKDTPMHLVTEQGLWECSVPEKLFGKYSKYKFIIESGSGCVYKADPYANFCELPPDTASVYYDISDYYWNDDPWMKGRKETVIEPDFSIPLNIYELHAGSWKKKEDGSLYNYRELAHELAPYIKQMGYTHVELMPISEFPFDGSWGYQVCGYYAPTSRFGEPHDFMYFVDYMHKCGIGVILDWVPAHFPKDEHGLYEFDGGPLYEYSGKDKMENEGWGTRKFDVGRNEVECFLISNAMFWLRKYHIDGLRVDAVASMLYLDYDKEPGEWVPNAYGGKECLEAIAFFNRLGDVIRAEYPDVLFIAEESTAWPKVSKRAAWDGLGFNYKWNMGWMHDVLDYFSMDPYFRKDNHDKLTFSMMYAYSENYILPISHDEVVHGKKSLLDKMPGDYAQKFAGARSFFAYMMAHPGKKLMFMGAEIGQFTEWNYKSSVEWFLLDYDSHKKLQSFVSALNHLYLENSEMWEVDYSWEGFEWVECDNRAESIIALARKNKAGERITAVFNLTPVARENYPIGVPLSGRYKELLNSDDTKFGGGGMLNGTVTAKKEGKGLYPYTVKLNLPPLSAIFIKQAPKRKKTEEK